MLLALSDFNSVKSCLYAAITEDAGGGVAAAMTSQREKGRKRLISEAA